MKRTLAISLVLLIGALSCTLPLRYSLKQVARAVMDKRLKAESVSALQIFAASELSDAKWESRHEFRLHGILYDVAQIDWKDGVRQYHCVSDELEMKVEHDADDRLISIQGHKPVPSRDNNAARIFDWLQNLFFQHDIGFSMIRFSPESGPAFPVVPGYYAGAPCRLPAEPPEA